MEVISDLEKSSGIVVGERRGTMEEVEVMNVPNLTRSFAVKESREVRC